MKQKTVICDVCKELIEPGEESISFKVKRSTTAGYEVCNIKDRFDICYDCQMKLRMILNSYMINEYVKDGKVFRELMRKDYEGK